MLIGEVINWIVQHTAEPRTLTKLREFKSMPIGWYYGSGGPIDQRIVDLAKLTHEMLTESGFTYTDAFPGAEGEIQLTAYHADHFISIIIENNERMSFVHERDRVDVFPPEEDLAINDIRQKLKRSSRAIWNSLDTPTQNILIGLGNASPKWGLKNHPQMIARQL